MVAELHPMARLQCPFRERLRESSRSDSSNFHTRSFLSPACQQNNSSLCRTRDVTNGILKIVKFIFMRDLEELRVVCCEVQSEFEILPLLLLRQTKPTQDRNALESEIFTNLDLFGADFISAKITECVADL